MSQQNSFTVGFYMSELSNPSLSAIRRQYSYIITGFNKLNSNAVRITRIQGLARSTFVANLIEGK